MNCKYQGNSNEMYIYIIKLFLVIKIQLKTCKRLLKFAVIHDNIILNVAIIIGFGMKSCVLFLQCLWHSKLKGLCRYLTAGNTISAALS